MTKSKTVSRFDGRKPDELRAIRFQKNFAAASKGSVLISMGRTRVLCGVSVDEKVPGWMRAQKVPGGWITAEYSMLPLCLIRAHAPGIIFWKGRGSNP